MGMNEAHIIYSVYIGEALYDTKTTFKTSDIRILYITLKNHFPVDQ